jgi:hypothetical protein
VNQLAVLLVACAKGPACETVTGRWAGLGDRDLRFDVGSILVASLEELRLPLRQEFNAVNAIKSGMLQQRAD